MQLVIDEDVRAVAEFMHGRMQASRLVAVARGLSDIAPLLWGHYKSDSVRTISAVAEAILPDDPHRLSDATGLRPESDRVDGDFGAATVRSD